MDVPVEQVIDIFQYLLPGFLTGWVFYGLTSYAKPALHERIIQALIFTLIVQTSVTILKWCFLQVGERIYSFGVWTIGVAHGWSVIIAIALGVLVSYFANNDKIHAWLRNKNVTKNTSLASEWASAFHSSEEAYVVLHLVDERRIMGWPMEWPDDHASGHFILAEASWLITDNNETSEIELPGTEKLVVPGKEVQYVEFLTPVKQEN